jgi:hypothetical protein
VRNVDGVVRMDACLERDGERESELENDDEPDRESNEVFDFDCNGVRDRECNGMRGFERKDPEGEADPNCDEPDRECDKVREKDLGARDDINPALGIIDGLDSNGSCDCTGVRDIRELVKSFRSISSCSLAMRWSHQSTQHIIPCLLHIYYFKQPFGSTIALISSHDCSLKDGSLKSSQVTILRII